MHPAVVEYRRGIRAVSETQNENAMHFPLCVCSLCALVTACIRSLWWLLGEERPSGLCESRPFAGVSL